MASQRQRANIDLVKKLKLERQFIIKLRKLFRAMTDEFAAEYANNGNILQAVEFESEFQALIVEQYRRAGKAFKRTTRDSIGSKSLEVKAASDDIDNRLREYTKRESNLAAAAISRTNQNKIENAIRKAMAILMFEETQGDDLGFLITSPTTEAIAKEARRLLNIETTSRSDVIAVTETQKITEKAKEIEIDVLKSDQDFIGATGGAEIIKSWINVGDDKVRETHVQAQFDNIKIPANEAFSVGNYRLMIPGDASLGAPLEEIINCRCSAIYDVKGL